MIGKCRLLHAKLLALPLVLASGFAWGQSEEEVTAAAGKEIDAYTGCLREQVRELAKTISDDDAVVDGAMRACQGKRSDLLQKLQEPSLSLPLEDAMSSLEDMDNALRPLMVEAAKKARG